MKINKLVKYYINQLIYFYFNLIEKMILLKLKKNEFIILINSFISFIFDKSLFKNYLNFWFIKILTKYYFHI